MAKDKTYFVHQCELPSSDVCFLEIPPYLPKLKKWFRSMRTYFAVNENSVRTKALFRSYTAIKAEKRRHANSYPWTIHPYSIGAIYRERILCFIWLFIFANEPISVANDIMMTGDAISKETIIDLLLFINIFLTACTGYYDRSRKEIILCPKKIFKEQFFTYLLPEFYCCMPVITILEYFMGDEAKNPQFEIIYFARCVRCLRLPDCFQYLNNFLREMNFPEKLYSWFFVCLINLYSILWLSCILIYVNVVLYTYEKLPEGSILRNRAPQGDIGSNIIKPEDNFGDTFITVLTTSTCHYFGASEGYVPIDLISDRIMCSLILICGYVVSVFSTAKILQTSKSTHISETKYEELTYQIEEYAHLKNLPDTLKKRLDIYHEYKFQRRYFKEEVILATLSEHLRNEVILYGVRNVLEKVPLFQGVMKGVIGTVLGYMKKEIYLPGDIVLKYADPLTKMFFVSFGTLAAHYGPDAVEILHFEDGDHFGDLSITTVGGQAQLTVVALEITEIFTLSRKDVKHCTHFLKEMSERVIKLTKTKYLLYSMLTQMMSNEASQNNVLADLREGRILERERRRIK